MSDTKKTVVHIRWMILRDLPKVVEIEQLSSDDAWNEKKMLNSMRQRNVIGLIASSVSPDNEQILGFIVYELNKRTIDVLKFCVDPPARRSKVGSQMIERLQSKLQNLRRTRIRINLERENGDARAFLEKHGFTEIIDDDVNDVAKNARLMEYRLPGSTDEPEEEVAASTDTAITEVVTLPEPEDPQPIVKPPRERVNDDVHVRWMIRMDMPEVMQIEMAGFSSPWEQERLMAHLMQRNCIGMSAELDPKGRQKIVGFMVYELHEGRLHLLNIAVHPDHRRIGMGRLLMEKLKGKLSAQRRTRISIELREENPVAEAFLTRMDFTKVDSIEGHTRLREGATLLEFHMLIV